MKMEKNKIKLIDLHFNYIEDFKFESIDIKFLYGGKEKFIIIKAPEELTIDEIKNKIIAHYDYPKYKEVI